MKKASLAGGAASELTRAADRYQKAAVTDRRSLTAALAREIALLDRVSE